MFFDSGTLLFTYVAAEPGTQPTYRYIPHCGTASMQQILLH